MESKRPIVLGTPESIHKLMGKRDEYITSGVFVHDENKIYTSVHGDTLSHEKGHQFDYDRTKVSYFFSDDSAAWYHALAREQSTGWRGEKAVEEILGYSHKSISSHLKQGYMPEQFSREAMAQMTAIYNKVYNEYNWDITPGPYSKKERVEKTNALMEKAYPELFPVYRDEFIPHAIKKASDLSNASDIEEKKEPLKKITRAAKFVGTLLPTNFDNLVIASIAGGVTMGWSKVTGEPLEKAIHIGGETAAEISGVSAVVRSYEAGKKGDHKEASIQAVDALGIPVVAVREKISDLENEQRMELVKAINLALPKTASEATFLEKIIRTPQTKEMMKDYANVLSLKEQNEGNSSNTDIQAQLTSTENKFSKTLGSSTETLALSKKTLSEIEEATAFANALRNMGKEPAASSNSIPYGVVHQKPTGIAPG